MSRRAARRQKPSRHVCFLVRNVIKSDKTRRSSMTIRQADKVLEQRPCISDFMRLFIAALVLRDKRYIWRRKERAVEERHRMYALHKHLNEYVEKMEQSDRDWLYFVLKLRNELSPGNIGSFDGFYHQFRLKQMTIVSIDWPECNYYRLELQPVTAKCYLEQGDPRLCELAEKCADVYMAQTER
jgi:hypothetical protein